MKLLSFLTLIFAFISSAQAYDLRSDLVEKKSYLSISGEMSQFTLKEGTLGGTGVKVDFSHAFTRAISFEVYVSTAFSGGGTAASFTGLGGYALYNVLGNCCEENRTVTVDGATVITERLEQNHLLQIGAGLDQILLNGSKGVYSTSGIGFGGNYQFKLWDFRFKASARFSQMTTNEEKVQATFFGLGIVFPL